MTTRYYLGIEFAEFERDGLPSLGSALDRDTVEYLQMTVIKTGQQ